MSGTELLERSGDEVDELDVDSDAEDGAFVKVVEDRLMRLKVESTTEDLALGGGASSPECAPATGTKIPPRGMPSGVMLLF